MTPDLTERERAVVVGLAHGVPYKMVAADLGISIPSVNEYRRRALAKLGTEDLARAARRVRRRDRARAAGAA